MTRAPSLFVSHGSPMLALEDGPARRFLLELGPRLGRPAGVVVVSAHFEADVPTVTAAAHPGTIHDFGGFPRALHEMIYPAPGSPELADMVGRALAAASIASAVDETRGLDHGAWVPLALTFPKADVPVVQLSISPGRDPAWHYALGEALRPLRGMNVLILGSGSITHNLRELERPTPGAPPAPWAEAFTEWVHDKVEARETGALLHYETRAPEAARAHPSDDHFLPFFTALGAGAEDEPAARLHHSFTYGALGMDAYAFGALPG